MRSELTPQELDNIVGRLTEEQSVYLLQRLIVQCSFHEVVVRALEDSLSKDEKEELGESWFNIDK